jgi:hypothetical protein
VRTAFDGVIAQMALLGVQRHVGCVEGGMAYQVATKLDVGFQKCKHSRTRARIYLKRLGNPNPR